MYKTLIGLLGLVALVLPCNVQAQTGPCPNTTTLVLNPTHACFTPSPDHALVEFGVAKVASYLFETFVEGADPNTATPVQTADLGKPTPVQNAIWVPRNATGLVPGTRYVAYVTAISQDQLRGRSVASNPFGVTSQRPPAAPGRPSLTQGQ